MTSSRTGTVGALWPLHADGARLPGPVNTSPLVALAATGRPADATSGRTVADWARSRRFITGPTAAVEEGLAREDVDLWVLTTPAEPGGLAVSEQAQANRLLSHLGTFSRFVGGGDVTLRAACAWWLLSARMGVLRPGATQPIVPPALTWWATGAPGVAFATDVGHRWRAVTDDASDHDVAALAEVGWILAAAGVSRVEAEEAAVAGTLDLDAALALAALQGAPLPHTR